VQYVPSGPARYLSHCQPVAALPSCFRNFVLRSTRRTEPLWFALKPFCVCPCLTTIQGLCIVANATCRQRHDPIIRWHDPVWRLPTTIVWLLLRALTAHAPRAGLFLSSLLYIKTASVPPSPRTSVVLPSVFPFLPHRLSRRGRRHLAWLDRAWWAWSFWIGS
jgi:hypothetical protein